MTAESQEVMAPRDLGMDGIRAVLLLEHFGSLDAVLAADHEELTAVHGVAEATARRIRAAADDEILISL